MLNHHYYTYIDSLAEVQSQQRFVNSLKVIPGFPAQFNVSFAIDESVLEPTHSEQMLWLQGKLSFVVHPVL